MSNVNDLIKMLTNGEIKKKKSCLNVPFLNMLTNWLFSNVTQNKKIVLLFLIIINFTFFFGKLSDAEWYTNLGTEWGIFLMSQT